MTTLLRAVIDGSGLSRRKAFAAIRDGRVRSGRFTLTEPSVEYNGEPLSLDGQPLGRGAAEKVYLLLNKPPGCVTTASDERGRSTVVDFVPAPLRASGLHAVGRLDLDTSGLLILTNDGDLTYHLTHPSNEVDKEYWVGLFEVPTDDVLNTVWQGVVVDGELRQPLEMERLRGHEPFHVSISIGEGRKRQVRRMFELAGARVRHLRRVREGKLRLGNLPEGKTRRLTEAEVNLLQG
ncbi:MAG: pseudouridine synthase [Dehalococcoidia bacterium]